MQIAQEVENLEKQLDIPSVPAEKKGFRLVEDAEYLEAFQCFNLVIVDQNGIEHDVFSVNKSRDTRFDNGVADYDTYLDTYDSKRRAKLDEMQEYYTAAAAAAEKLEQPAIARGRKLAKANGVKATQDQLEAFAANFSLDIPGFFDEDETDD